MLTVGSTVAVTGAMPCGMTVPIVAAIVVDGTAICDAPVVGGGALATGICVALTTEAGGFAICGSGCGGGCVGEEIEEE